MIVTNMTAATALLPPLLILLAYFMLRKNFDAAPRGFRMGSRSFGLVVAAFLLVVFCFVLICGTIPLDQPLWLTLVYNVGGVVVFLGLAVMWYNRYINRLRETDPEAAESELRPSVLDMIELRLGLICGCGINRSPFLGRGLTRPLLLCFGAWFWTLWAKNAKYEYCCKRGVIFFGLF